MEKSNLIKIIDEIFFPLGFKRKGNSWVNNGSQLSKIINLQKSNYGNLFYLNYGFILTGLKLTTSMHVENRLAGIDQYENKMIKDLLDLESKIEFEKRIFELKKMITNKILSTLQDVNTEEELLKELKKRQHLNDIPLTVKRHFNLT